MNGFFPLVDWTIDVFRGYLIFLLLFSRRVFPKHYDYVIPIFFHCLSWRPYSFHKPQENAKPEKIFTGNKYKATCIRCIQSLVLWRRGPRKTAKNSLFTFLPAITRGADVGVSPQRNKSDKGRFCATHHQKIVSLMFSL